MKTAVGLAALMLSLCATSVLGRPIPLTDAQLNSVVAGGDFMVVNEVADQSGVAPTTDPLLQNAWGLSQFPGGPLWVANNGTGTSTLYDASFNKVPLNVVVPDLGGAQGAPTGTVFTSVTGNTFRVSEGGKTGHSLFLFDTAGGTISGWAPNVDFTHAIIAVDQSSQGAVFKGLTMAAHGSSGAMLYAADFGNGRVDVFNNQFHQTGSFTDTSLPAGYAPFNVQALNGKIYVAFALKGEGIDEQHGAGLGFVDVFDAAGHKLQRLVSGGPLNAPWGLTIAPASFGKFAGALLVGNFGDGKVNAFNVQTGAFLGQLTAPGGAPIAIDGLWALRQGSDGVLIFSSGPDDQAHGLVGVIRPSFAPASWAFQAHATMNH